jgi:hypothetical protein
VDAHGHQDVPTCQGQVNGAVYPVKPLVCTCGEVFEAIDEMDEHLWEAFVPASDIGLDGKMHAELNRTWLLARLANDDGDDEDKKHA